MKHSMQTDMMKDKWFCDQVKLSESYAQNLYAAMCNNEFQKQDTWQVLSDQRWSCSWRAAGSVVATLREQGDYMSWYCSGMGGFADWESDPDKYYAETGYVQESVVTDQIRQDLLKLGWIVVAADK